MAIEVECTVHSVKQTKQITESFKARDVIVCVDPSSQYPAYVTLTAKQGNTDKLDELRPGDKVKFHLNLDGRLYTNKQGEEAAFTTLTIWKFDVIKTVPDQQKKQDEPKKPWPPEDDDDPLPF